MPDFAKGGRRVAGFLTKPLVDLPDEWFSRYGQVGRAVEGGIEGFTSPIGLASAALLPVTGGSSLGLRGLAGAGTKVATRGAAELAVGSGASLGANVVNDNLPENTPGFLRVAGTIAGGLGAGAVTSAGVGKGLYEATPAPKVREVQTPRVPIDLTAVPEVGLTKAGKWYMGPTPGVENAARIRGGDINIIKRGKNNLLSRIKLEKLIGGLDPVEAEIGERFIQALPEKYVSNLASSYFKNPLLMDENISGFYKSEESLMTLIKSVVNPNTIPHEIGHHLEPFVDEKDFTRLRKAWGASIQPQKLKYDTVSRQMDADILTWETSLRQAAKEQRAKVEIPPELRTLKDARESLERETPYAVKGGFNEWFAEIIGNRALDDPFPRNRDLNGIVNKIRATYDDVKVALDDAMRGVDTRTPDKVYDSFMQGEYGTLPDRPAFRPDSIDDGHYANVWDGKSDPQNPEQAARFEEMRKLREGATPAKPAPIDTRRDTIMRRDGRRNELIAKQRVRDGYDPDTREYDALNNEVRDILKEIEKMDRELGDIAPRPEFDHQPLEARYTPDKDLRILEAMALDDIGKGLYSAQDSARFHQLMAPYADVFGIVADDSQLRSGTWMDTLTDEEWAQVLEQARVDIKRAQS